MTELQNAIDALRKIKTQADLNALAEEWKRQMNYIGANATRGMKKGDTITWEYKGTVKSGTIKKLNHKTCEVVGAGGSPFGSTTYKIYCRDKYIITWFDIKYLYCTISCGSCTIK